MILYLAPLHGYTEAYFRNAYSKYFDCFDHSIAPFIASGKGDNIKSSRIKDMLHENNDKMPVDPQIIGKYAPDFISLSKYLYEYGYNTLNINMGCPIPGIAKKMRGSGIMPYPEMVEMLLEKLFAEIPNEITLKLRLGYHSKDEISHLLPLLNQFPLKELIIHPRLGIQMYTGTPDLDAFEWCVNNSNIPVVYSGDIFSVDKMEALMKKFPKQEKWMIGRGVIYDIFLPYEIKNGRMNPADKRDLFKIFHQALFEEVVKYRNRPRNSLNKMKEFWAFFSRQFVNYRQVYYDITRTERIEEFQEKSLLILNEEQWRKEPIIGKPMSE
jgi:tRNA-dihydrouridine synthase B